MIPSLKITWNKILECFGLEGNLGMDSVPQPCTEVSLPASLRGASDFNREGKEEFLGSWELIPSIKITWNKILGCFG